MGGARMITDKKAFGNYLRKMIKQAGMTQLDFYTAVEIAKPYFYDILSGKVNPPPPDMQYKMLKCLDLDEKQRNEFLNLAAKGRNEIPADVARLITNHPEKIDLIRQKLAEIFTTQ